MSQWLVSFVQKVQGRSWCVPKALQGCMNKFRPHFVPHKRKFLQKIPNIRPVCLIFSPQTIFAFLIQQKARFRSSHITQYSIINFNDQFKASGLDSSQGASFNLNGTNQNGILIDSLILSILAGRITKPQIKICDLAIFL